MRNFDYLQQRNLTELHRFCKAAEELQLSAPDMSAINARLALEYIVRTLYTLKHVEMGERTSLYELVDGEPFRSFVEDERIIRAAHYVRRVGNNAAHGVNVTKRESFFCLLNLYNVVGAILLKLRVVDDVAPFDNALLPKAADKEPVIVPLSPTITPNDTLVAAADTDSLQDKSPAVLLPTDITEAETRACFIDLMLHEAGWDILTTEGLIQAGKACIEVELQGMPNAHNVGYADYVLFGANGKPLAVIEAKRTTKSPEVGKHQAELYADCLEQQYGVRPVIYYTNGFKTYIIDGLGYPPRELICFHTAKDLELLIQQRGRKDITDTAVRDDITNREYQKRAIKSICEHFNAKHRRGLIVMATGTGKTRVSISLTELLARNGWVKNALFLADRTSLVNQAHKNFVKLLPNMPTCVLSDKSNADKNLDARLIFSTYQTMINAIDEDTKLFSVGRFDLIIIDEAHRSIFGKYGAIFQYFDALLVGLTATPRDEVDHSTYQVFNLEQGEPNFAYELDEAVGDHYLVNYTGFKRGTLILKEGITYSKLTAEEKEQLEPVWEYEQAKKALDLERLTDNPNARDISSKEIFSYIFNIDTVDKVLTDLMTNGLQVQGGERIGKTIIFAYSHRHAEMIVERFHALYPEYGSDFCVVIDNYVNYSQDLINKLEVRNHNPQIAVTVDMLETGIDIPDILNLVFFKVVKSKIKFMQMIGRGTRLSPGIFGNDNQAGEEYDKKEFYIFDWCRNFEYFEANPNGKEAPKTLSLTERLFGLRTDIAFHLQHQQYQEDAFVKSMHDELKQTLRLQVDELSDHNLSVRNHWETVTHFRALETWTAISEVDVLQLKTEIAPLLAKSTEGEYAKRFDIIVLTISLSLLDEQVNPKKCIGKVCMIANLLQKKATIPQVQAKMATIQEVLTNEWTDLTLDWLEKVRLDLRDLLQFLDGEAGMTFVVDIQDTLQYSGETEGVLPRVSYRQRVLEYLAQNRDYAVIQKIRNIEQLTAADLQTLEHILWEELGDKSEYDKLETTDGAINVAAFIRSLIGIDYAKAAEKFSALLSMNNLNSEQEEFLKAVVSYVCENGDITKGVIVNNEQFSECGNIFGPMVIRVAQYITILHDAILPKETA